MDINTNWVAKIQTAEIHRKQGVDHEKEWLMKQFNKLADSKKQRMPIPKMRRYLLENFCHPMYVEEFLLALMNSRFEQAMKDGNPPKYY